MQLNNVTITFQLSGIMQEGNVDDVSWIFHEIGMMPFIETVCETGFRAGHYSFHWLTGKPEIMVHSFESSEFNFTEDMATFMTAEFPDRYSSKFALLIKNTTKVINLKEALMCAVGTFQILIFICL